MPVYGPAARFLIRLDGGEPCAFYGAFMRQLVRVLQRYAAVHMNNAIVDARMLFRCIQIARQFSDRPSDGLRLDPIDTPPKLYASNPGLFLGRCNGRSLAFRAYAAMVKPLVVVVGYDDHGESLGYA